MTAFTYLLEKLGNYFLIFFLLLSLTFIQSCKTHPPNAPQAVEFARAYITSNVDSAQIYLDDVNTGKVTPDTITAILGTHIVKLEKLGYFTYSQEIEFKKDITVNVPFLLQEIVTSKIVLLEDFANVSCGPCVQSNLIIESLSRNTYEPSKIVIIKYATFFPGANDPFYLASKNDCDARISYYNIMSAPTLYVDGIMKPISTDSTAIKESIDKRLLIETLFELTVSDSISGNVMYIKVIVKTFSTNNLNFSDLVLHTVLTETDIEFSTAPGNNGETKFYHVMRAMLPTNNGESIISNNQIGTVTYNRQIAINPQWNISNLHTIAFIQNTSTKEVVQAGSN